eukprot:m.100990 g.100990  ORF g.100990 m.100990 type:complete len:2741 (+) comp37106_c0_seq1:120-8342(+)
MAKAKEEKDLGNQCFKERKFEEALRHYSNALQSHVSCPHEVFSNRSFAHLKLEQPRKALQDAEKAIQLDAAFVKAYYRKGEAHKALGEFLPAVQALCDGLTRSGEVNLDRNFIVKLTDAVLMAEGQLSPDAEVNTTRIIEKGKKIIVKAFLHCFKKKAWQKISGIWSDSQCRNIRGMKSRIVDITPVADVLAAATATDRAILIDFLAELGIGLSSPYPPDSDMTPLRIARRRNSHTAALKLLGVGANPSTFLYSSSEHFPNAVAAWTMDVNDGNTEIIDYVHKRNGVSYDKDYNSPLHAVCCKPYKESEARRSVILKLLELRYKPDEANSNKKTPFDLLDSNDWRFKMFKEHMVGTEQNYLASPAADASQTMAARDTKEDAKRTSAATTNYPDSSKLSHLTTQCSIKPGKEKDEKETTRAPKRKKGLKSRKARNKAKRLSAAKKVQSSSTASQPLIEQASDPCSHAQFTAEPTSFDSNTTKEEASELSQVSEQSLVEEKESPKRSPANIQLDPKVDPKAKPKEDVSDLQNQRHELQDLLKLLPERNYQQMRLAKVRESNQLKPAKNNRVEENTSSAPRNEELDVSQPNLRKTNKVGFKKAADRLLQCPWEVRCTAKVWEFLQDGRNDTRVVQKINKNLEALCNGDFQSNLSNLCCEMEGVPEGMMLFEAKVDENISLIWDIAVAFSPRLSLVPKRKDSGEGCIHVFCEVIHVWDVVYDSASLNKKKEEVLKSYEKGKTAVTTTALEGEPEAEPKENLKACLKNRDKSGPRKFKLSSGQVKKGAEEFSYFPPANPAEKDFNIVTFYPLVNEMMVPNKSDVNFPFDINPDEFEIINSEQKESTLLLGRSGTGKTTCCLFKMWRSFENYWKLTKPENPHYRRRIIEQEDDKDGNSEETRVARPANTSRAQTAPRADENDDGLVKILPPRAERIKLGEEKYLTPSSSAKTESVSCQQFTATIACPERPVAVDSDSSCQEKVTPSSGPSKEMSHHLLQIFITKNSRLRDQFRKYFLGLSHAHDFTVPHRKLENIPLPFKIQEFNALQFPCFLTMREWLFLLDASLPGPSFFPRSEGKMLHKINIWGDKDGLLTSLLDLKEDSDNEPDTDEPFEHSGDVSSHLTEAINRATTFNDKNQKYHTEITFAYFKSKMWSKVGKGFTSYDPLLVWTEIKSFIKGSVEALRSKSQRGYLELKEYLAIGRKRAPNFEGNRDEVYEMFVRYCRLKKQLAVEAYDECDLVFHLYDRLTKVPASNMDWAVNQLYVDEAQDFTQAEIALLMRCCQDPNSVFLTGDTAQCIMRGVSFRFKDMKTLFRYSREDHPELDVLTPPVSKLRQNYRSHSGILEVASSVVDLMESYFKDSFDLLPRDNGLLKGPKPAYLETTRVDSLALMLMGNKRKTYKLEFGAHQVVLVRSEESLKNLPDELKCAIAMTIFDAKGLEFDDVLLYNFFTDSKVEKDWRVIYSHIKEKCPQHILSSQCRPLEFRATEHKFLESELKHLYTAVTRARCNLWIYDSDEKKRSPMLEYLKAKSLIQIVSGKQETETENSSEAFSFTSSSTPEQWEKTGDFFLRHKRFRQAATCFEKAETKEKYYYSWACFCSTEALKCDEENRGQVDDGKEKWWIKAATNFLQAGKPSRAALCLLKGGEKELAARVWERTGEPGEAAKVYQSLAGRLSDAVRCWEKALDFRNATELLCRHSRYEEAVELLGRCRQLSEENPELVVKDIIKEPPKGYTVSSLLWRAARDCHGRKDFEGMRRAVDRFPELEDRIKFFRKTGQIDEIADVLIKGGRAEEMKEMLWEQGKFIKAAERLSNMGSKFQGDCYFAHVMALAGEDSIEVSCEYLDKAKDCYEVCRDNSGVGSCLFLEGDLRKNILFFGRAKDKFQKAACWCGEIEATAARAKLKFATDKDLKTAEQAIERAVKLCCSIFQRRSSEDKKQVDNCARFYGLLQSNDAEFTVYSKTKCRFLTLDKEHAGSGPRESEDGSAIFIEKNAACALLAKHIASVLVDLVALSRKYLKKNLEVKNPCHNFAVGYGCSNRDCQGHEPIDAKFWNKQIHNVVLATKLEMIVSSAWKRLQKFAECKKGLQSLSKENFGWLLDYIRKLVCPTGSEVCLISCNRLWEGGLLKLRTERAVREKLAEIVKVKWLEKDENRRLGNVNLVQRFWRLFILINGKDGVKDFNLLLKQDEEKFVADLRPLRYKQTQYYRQRHGDINFASSLEHCDLFTNLWKEARRQYSAGDVIGSAETMTSMLGVSMTRRLTANYAPPLLTETLNILEMSSLYCILALVHLLPYRDLEAYVPQSYIEAATFWDIVTQQDEDFLVNSIQVLRFNSDVIRNVRGFLYHIVDMITGMFVRRFYILQFALTRRHCIDSGGAERMLILAITLLLNCARVEMEGHLEKANFLALSLKSVIVRVEQTSNLRLPARLWSVLKATANAKNDLDFAAVLSELLKPRHEKVMVVTKEDSRLCFNASNLDGYANAPRQISESARATEVDSTHKKESKADDDNDDDDDALDKDEERWGEEEREETAQSFFTRHLLRRYFDLWKTAIQKRQEYSDRDSSSTDYFSRFSIDDSECRICRVHFRQEEEAEDEELSKKLQFKEEHLKSSTHASSREDFEKYKEEYSKFQIIGHEIQEILKKASKHNMLEFDKINLQDEFDAFCKTVRKYELTEPWKTTVKHLKEATQLRSQSSELLKQVELEDLKEVSQDNSSQSLLDTILFNLVPEETNSAYDDIESAEMG